MNNRFENCICKLKGQSLNSIKLACQMIMFDFGKYAIHAQSLTRVIKDNDILFTTYDYQSWDQIESSNNDETYFLNKYNDEIINGKIIEIVLSKTNDLKLYFDNGIVIEIYVSNGYFHYEEEQEQYRLMIFINDEQSIHAVVFNKHIEFTDEPYDE